LFHLLYQTPDLKHPHDKRIYKVPTIPVCHDFNILTRSVEHLDLIVGFSTGPLQYVHPLQKEAVCAFNEDVSTCLPCCPVVGRYIFLVVAWKSCCERAAE